MAVYWCGRNRYRKMTPERIERLKEVASRRQPTLAVVLENVHDPHNIGAVLRSCDAVGVMEVFILYTESHLDRDHLELGKRASGGVQKWMDIHLYTNAEACFRHVKGKYDYLLATHLGEAARSLYEIDFTQSTALLFGNEHDGVSETALAYADGNLLIPQMGMARSLNISVACAVTLYEAMRQRLQAGLYGSKNPLSSTECAALAEAYIERSDRKNHNRKIRKSGE